MSPFNLKSMSKIYLDHSATTPLDPKVREKIHPYMVEIYGNASSAHYFGQEAMKGIDWAREQLSQMFKCKFKEVVFTSGATESNNLVVQGHDDRICCFCCFWRICLADS